MVKYGGGSRVKRVLVRDNWDKISDQAGQKSYFVAGEQSAKFLKKVTEG